MFTSLFVLGLYVGPAILYLGWQDYKQVCGSCNIIRYQVYNEMDKKLCNRSQSNEIFFL